MSFKRKKKRERWKVVTIAERYARKYIVIFKKNDLLHWQCIQRAQCCVTLSFFKKKKYEKNSIFFKVFVYSEGEISFFVGQVEMLYICLPEIKNINDFSKINGTYVISETFWATLYLEHKIVRCHSETWRSG